MYFGIDRKAQNKLAWNDLLERSVSTLRQAAAWLLEDTRQADRFDA